MGGIAIHRPHQALPPRPPREPARGLEGGSGVLAREGRAGDEIIVTRCDHDANIARVNQFLEQRP